MTLDMIFHSTVLILLILFGAHVHDPFMVVAIGLFITILTITYFRHSDTVLYTTYLTKRETMRHDIARMNHESNDDHSMETVFSLFDFPMENIHQESKKTGATVEEIIESSFTDSVAEKPDETSE